MRDIQCALNPNSTSAGRREKTVLQCNINFPPTLFVSL